MTRMARLRHGLFMRAVSAFVALTFSLSFVGIGYAAPSVTPESTDVVEETTSVDVGVAPIEGDPGVEPGSDPAPSVEAAPVTDEPDPVFESVEVQGGTQEPVPEQPLAGAVTSTKMVSAVAPVGGGGSVQLSLEGYATSPNTLWTTGNLGKLYQEGDWVPYRLIINNSNGEAPYTMPAFAFEYDHYNSHDSAVGVDRTRNWNVTYTPTQPASGDSNVYSGSAIAPSVQDAPSPSGSYGSSAFLRTSFPAGTVIVPAGEYAVVYFQAHLSLTAYWRAQTPSRMGSGYYPGSSMQMRLASDAGDKTVPIPIPPRPSGALSGVKYLDADHDGVRDAGEPGLEGWVFHLTGGPEGFPLDVTTVSGPDGTFSFPYLPPATYTLSEELPATWVNTTGLPISVSVVEETTTSVEVGNYPQDVTKAWRLMMRSLPANSSAFVRFMLGTEERELALTGAGPAIGALDVPFGSVISDVRWYVLWAGEEVLLGSTSGETMLEDYENVFEYDASVSGHKFSDLDADGVWDAGEPGLAGWTIVLFRMTAGGPVQYASTTTGVDGSYTFHDVIPGDYVVHEVQQGGWIDMTSPVGTFSISNGVHLTGKDFGNLLVRSEITIEKTGVAAAHVGDTVPYTLVVTNTGNYLLTGVTVTDPMLGLVRDVGDLAAGASVTITADHVIAPTDADPLVNTATAMGISVFGEMVSARDDHTVDIVKPGISVDKTVDPAIGADPVPVTYTYVVTNTGEDTLYDVVLSDDHLAVPGATIGTLAPQQSVTLHASTTLGTTTTNIATVSGTDVLGLTVSDTDDARVEVFHPALLISKSAVPDVVIPGELVLYTYVVQNPGDTPLFDVIVFDDVLGFVGMIPVLPSGGSVALSLMSPVLTDTVNIGTAEGHYGTPGTPFFGVLIAHSSASVDVIHPAVTIEKTADTPAVLVGGHVEYTFLVTNTGDVLLRDLVVTDDHLGLIGIIPLLPVGDSFTLAAHATLDVTTYNVANVSGTDMLGHPVSDSDDETVEVFDPSISIVKTADPPVIHAGETVRYLYVVTNTGDIALTDVHVTDNVLGNIGLIPSLAPGQSMELDIEVPVLVDTVNVGTATGEYGIVETPFGGSVSDSDDAAVDVIAPAISVDKSAAPPDAVAGTPVTYYFTVTNTGDVPLYGIMVHDDVMGHIGTITELAAGASQTLSAVMPLDRTTTNVVTATGYDELQMSVSDRDELTVPVYDPAIGIVKTVSPATAGVGDPVTYTFDVSNTGDITLTDVLVEDDILGIIGSVMQLEPGAHVIFTITIPAPVEDVTNIGQASGSYLLPLSESTGRVYSSDPAHLDVVHPAIEVEKSVSAPRIVGGQSVTYYFSAHNVGDVPLHDVVLTDDQLGIVGTVSTLEVGAWAFFSVSTPLDETTVNVVDGVAHDEWGHEVTDSDSARVEVFHPAVDIVKSVDRDVLLAGEETVYIYHVTNTGDITLHDLFVTDDVLGPIGGITVLTPGEHETLTMSAPVFVDTVNVGTVVGYYGEMEQYEEIPDYFFGSVTDSDDASVDVVAPAIDVVKSVTPDLIAAGESVTYTFIVTNTGDVDLFGVTLDDDKLGSIASLETLEVGDSRTFTRTTSLLEPTTNLVVARGEDRVGHDVSDQATAFVDVFLPFTPPDVTIDKSADKTSASAGDLVTYTLRYRNIGGSPAYDMTIVDDFDERYVTIESAAGGVVSDGKITWTDAGPLYPDDPARTITYTARIDKDLPLSVKHIDNTVIIREPTEENTDNNSDSWRVDIGEPFLPFTGFEGGLLVLSALLAAAAGLFLRRHGRTTS